jgi:hypothetical protein
MFVTESEFEYEQDIEAITISGPGGAEFQDSIELRLREGHH